MKRHMQRSMMEYIELLQIISRAQSTYISQREPKAVFEGLLDDLLRITASEYGFIGEIFYNDDRSPYLKTRAISNIAWNDETRELYEKKSPSGMDFFNLETLFGQVISSGEPVIANSPGEDPRRGGLPEGHPAIKSFLGIPFYLRDEQIGMVGIANRRGGYDVDLIDFLEPFLATCSQIINAFRLDQGRRRALSEVEIAKNQAMKANQAKTEFLANISHELRTPLNAIVGYTELLQEEFDIKPHDQNAEVFAKILRSGQHVLDLINDILDLSKSEAGELKPNYSYFNVKSCLEQVKDMMHDQISERNNQFSMQLSQNIGHIYCDEAYLRQILLNIIGNANKFTNAGQISLHCERHEQGRDEVISITVSDNGPGIAESKVQTIFEAFAQDDYTSSKSYAGSGIGLTLSQRILQSLGGKIELDSKLGQGTKVKILLPCNPSSLGVAVA